MEELVNMAELVRRSGISRRTLFLRQQKEASWPHARTVGGRRLWDWAEVRAWLEARKLYCADDPKDFVSVAMIAKTYGSTSASVDGWYRRYAAFPDPVLKSGGANWWRRDDVEAWHAAWLAGERSERNGRSARRVIDKTSLPKHEVVVAAEAGACVREIAEVYGMSRREVSRVLRQWRLGAG